MTPLKLLKPKEAKFNNDEEFIEHFLNEKRKQEKKIMASKKKKKSKGGLVTLKLGHQGLKALMRGPARGGNSNGSSSEGTRDDRAKGNTPFKGK